MFVKPPRTPKGLIATLCLIGEDNNIRAKWTVTLPIEHGGITFTTTDYHEVL